MMPFTKRFLLLVALCACSHSNVARTAAEGGDTPARTRAPVPLASAGAHGSLAGGSVPAAVTTTVVYRNVVDRPEDARAFKSAQESLGAGQISEGESQLEDYLKEKPSGQYADEASFLLGKSALKNGDPAAALRHLNRIVALKPPSRRRGQAYYLKATAEAQQGYRKEALDSLSRINVQEIPAAQKGELFNFWGSLALQDGHNLESTLAYIKAGKETREPAAKQKIESAVGDLVETRLSQPELQFLLNEYPNEFPSAPVQVRLAALKIAAGERDQAQTLLARALLQVSPGAPLHKRASEMLAHLSARGAGGISAEATLKIGALLPLSGDQEPIGRAVENGLREAFAKNNKQGLELVVADAGPSIETARAAFERLANEDKVVAVVGPLSGSQAEAVAPKAQELGITNITLAARTGLIEQGNYVFRVSLTPERQVRALVGYAHDRLSAKNFAIIFPRDNFGREFASEYFKAVKEWGGNVTAAESYDPDQSDFRVSIQNMTGMAFPNYRKTEAEEILKQQEEKSGHPLSRKEQQQFGLKPIVDFDVLLIPDTFRAVGQIVPALLYADVTTPKIIGPSTWNNAHLLQRAGQYLDGALFVDMFAPERQSATTRSFIDQYQLSKGSAPSSLAAMGYDIGIALKLAYGNDSPPSTRDELRARLERLGQLEGACGIYNWDARREPLTEVQLFQIRRGAFNHQGGVVIKAKND